MTPRAGAAALDAARQKPLEAVLRDARPNAWGELDPLPEARESQAAPFPFDGLGAILGAAGRSIARDVQAPDALAGGSVLASAALAAQAHADVVMPHGQRAPLSVYVVTAALSGDRKTATDTVASLPAEEYRREQARQHAAEVDRFERERADRKKGDSDPPKPVARSLTVGKATVEGLHMMLRVQPHIGIFTGEGGELLGGHSLREERRSAGLAWFLKAWGAETLDTLTRGDGLSILLGRRVSMHAMVQPVLLRTLLADPLAQGQGFLARCLVSEPGTLAGTRLFRAGNPAEALPVRTYHSALRALLARPSRFNEYGDGSELDNRQIGMSVEAAALWIEFYNAIETKQAANSELQGARAFASKAAEHAARIAGVVEVLNDPDAICISEAAMSGAIEVASFYVGEHVRLTGASQDDRRMAGLRSLLAWIQERGPVSHKDLLQRAPNSVRMLKAAGINPLIEELCERGYIRRRGDGWEPRP